MTFLTVVDYFQNQIQKLYSSSSEQLIIRQEYISRRVKIELHNGLVCACDEHTGMQFPFYVA